MRKERQPDASYGQGFHTMFPAALMPLADTRFPKATWPVLIWCWNKLSHRQFRPIRQEEIALTIGCARSEVSKAMALLLERGFLARVGAGPRQEWRLTLEATWVGTAGQYQAAKREAEHGLSAEAKRARFQPEVIDGGRDD